MIIDFFAKTERYCQFVLESVPNHLPDLTAAKDAFFTIRFGKNTRSCTHERDKTCVEELVGFKSCQITAIR